MIDSHRQFLKRRNPHSPQSCYSCDGDDDVWHITKIHGRALCGKVYDPDAGPWLGPGFWPKDHDICNDCKKEANLILSSEFTWREFEESVTEWAKNNQYPYGTEILWHAFYRPPCDPEWGSTDGGPSIKLDGTLEEAAAEAQKIAEKEGWILQCLKRRY